MSFFLPLARADNHLRAEFPHAYWRVAEVSFHADNSTARIRVRAWADKEAYSGLQEMPGHTHQIVEEYYVVAAQAFALSPQESIFRQACHVLIERVPKFRAAKMDSE